MNNYENAEPKILKTLNSDGQVLNSSGEVIADTSDYWVKTYNQAEPKPDKILHSDGTIKDSAGNLIQDTTPFNIKKYNQAEPIPAKYLHADGTIDENPGSGGADLEDNKTATIDVSTYTEPVEITPTAGKDGMKKTTVTLTNIPSGSVTLYDWLQDSYHYYLPFEVAPESLSMEELREIEYLQIMDDTLEKTTFGEAWEGLDYHKVSDTEFTFRSYRNTITVTRASEPNDITIW